MPPRCSKTTYSSLWNIERNREEISQTDMLQQWHPITGPCWNSVSCLEQTILSQKSVKPDWGWKHLNYRLRGVAQYFCPRNAAKHEKPVQIWGLVHVSRILWKKRKSFTFRQNKIVESTTLENWDDYKNNRLIVLAVGLFNWIKEPIKTINARVEDVS